MKPGETAQVVRGQPGVRSLLPSHLSEIIETSRGWWGTGASTSHGNEEKKRAVPQQGTHGGTLTWKHPASPEGTPKKGPGLKRYPWSWWLLHEWKACWTPRSHLLGWWPLHHPPGRDRRGRSDRHADAVRSSACGDTRSRREISAGDRGDLKPKQALAGRESGQFWFRGEWRFSAETFAWGTTCRFIHGEAFLVHSCVCWWGRERVFVEQTSKGSSKFQALRKQPVERQTASLWDINKREKSVKL